MLLDKYLMENLGLLGYKIMQKAELSSAPSNLEQLYHFFETLKIDAEINKCAAANMIYQVLYSFVSSEEVRDRHTSPREFEDIFCSIFGTSSTDGSTRENPIPTAEILEYDKFTTNEKWNVSTDLCSNKREKADVLIATYALSLKTLKGKCYNEEGEVTDKDYNDELNVGSFSYRALFKGILTDKELAKLGDRKKGLGSQKQMRLKVLNPIKKHRKCNKFLERLKTFFSYVYEEDLIIAIKSGYRMDIYFIPNKTVVETICLLYERDEKNFEKVWSRWENNNLRFKLYKLLEYMDTFELHYDMLTLDLKAFKNHAKIKKFNEKLQKETQKEIEELIREE